MWIDITPILEVTDSLAPTTTVQQITYQETDWPDAIPVQIPQVSSSSVQPEEQEIIRSQTRYNSQSLENLELEDNLEEEQFANLDSYLAHHNTYEASQYIHQEYRSHLHALDDDQYYAEINRAYYLLETPAAQDYQLAN